MQCEGSTAKRYRHLLRSHIVPALGVMPVGAVEREHIEALHHALRDERKQANNVLWVLRSDVASERCLGPSIA